MTSTPFDLNLNNTVATPARHRRPGFPLRIFAAAVFLSQMASGSALWPLRAEEPSPPAKEDAGKPSKEEATPPAPAVGEVKRSTKTYPVRNGSVTYSRTEESEKKVTADGEVETQRVRMPTYAGDRGVMFEREIRTRKLPDGSVEKEYVLKNLDGSGRLVPTEIVRERMRKEGETAATEREVLKPGMDGRWQSWRRESVTESGPESAKQAVKEVREPDITGRWRVVNREVSREKTSGETKETESVRQIPDAYGRLADYEVRRERSTARQGNESRVVTLERRDFQDTDRNRFYLVERTTTERTQAPDGQVVQKSTTESDLRAGGAARTIEPGGPRVVEERVEVEAPGPEGSAQSTVSVKERGVADPRLKRSYQVRQETNREGQVRQIFIPAN